MESVFFWRGKSLWFVSMDWSGLVGLVIWRWCKKLDEEKRWDQVIYVLLGSGLLTRFSGGLGFCFWQALFFFLSLPSLGSSNDFAFSASEDWWLQLAPGCCALPYLFLQFQVLFPDSAVILWGAQKWFFCLFTECVCLVVELASPNTVEVMVMLSKV